MHNSCLIIHTYACKRHCLALSAEHYHKKAHAKCQPYGLKIFGEKVKKWKNALSMPDHACHRHHLNRLGAHYLKLNLKFQFNLPNIF